MHSLPRESKTAFVHVGTHKTGTTSIQSMLAANAKTLRGAGVFVPLAGRIDRASARSTRCCARSARPASP
jgi:hypothetical protein